MAIGKYWQRFVHLEQSETTEPTYGQKEQTFRANGRKYWGYVKELSSANQLVYGTVFGRVGVEIVLRGYLDMSDKDRLSYNGDVYVLDGPSRTGDNETIFTAHRGGDVQ